MKRFEQKATKRSKVESLPPASGRRQSVVNEQPKSKSSPDRVCPLTLPLSPRVQSIDSPNVDSGERETEKSPPLAFPPPCSPCLRGSTSGLRR